MNKAVKAVIFDMDGVLIDSEHLWRKAMVQAFTKHGMPVTVEQCRQTMGMRISEVISIWLEHFGLSQHLGPAVERDTIQLLLQLISEEGRFIPHIPEIISLCENKKILMGLATSSSGELMSAIISKLGIRTKLSAAVSAENLPYAKPHPEVFLLCAQQLDVPPQQCLVIEDSLNGVIAARAARMQVIAVPDKDFGHSEQFAIAHHVFDTMEGALKLLQESL